MSQEKKITIVKRTSTTIQLVSAFVVALALLAFIQSFVGDLLLGSNLNSLFLVVKYPSQYDPSSGQSTPNSFASIATNGKGGQMTPVYNTIAQAQLAGAFTWNYGSFILNVINLLAILLVSKLMVKFNTRKFEEVQSA